MLTDHLLVPGTVLNVTCANSLPITVLWDRYYYYHHHHHVRSWGTQKLNNSLKQPWCSQAALSLEYLPAPTGMGRRCASLNFLGHTPSNTLICLFPDAVFWGRYYNHSPPNCTDEETKAEEFSNIRADVEPGFHTIWLQCPHYISP